ncbi:MAG: DUF302 domain-containing protein [Acidobacteriia bacterium]|nr:DUF302 domain-containing protein [Terriglobia bacterium]
MLITMESGKSIETVCALMEPTVQKHKFGVLSVHNLRQTMANKGVPFARECFIFEVCNPHQAKKVLEANMEVSTALPCRVAVYQEGNKVKLSTIKPTAMLAMYQAPELESVAKEVEQAITEIMHEVAE